MLFIAAAADSIQLSHPDTSRAAAPPFPMPSHIIPFSASAVFWRNPRIISGLPRRSVSTGQLPSYFRVPTSRRVLSCRKKMSFSRRDPSWFLHQLPSNHDRFLALFSNIRFASLAHRTLAGSRKAHEWDGSFCSRDLSSHIFCGSASYFVTRRLSLPCHSTLICIAAAALGRVVGLSLILVDSFCCTAPADLHFYTDQQ